MKTILSVIVYVSFMLLTISYFKVSYELGNVKNSTIVESCLSSYDKGVWDTKIKYNLQ